METNNRYEIIKDLFKHNINGETVVYYNKFYPLFLDFLLWKSDSNIDSKYEIENSNIKEKINKELIPKKCNDLLIIIKIQKYLTLKKIYI